MFFFLFCLSLTLLSILFFFLFFVFSFFLIFSLFFLYFSFLCFLWFFPPFWHLVHILVKYKCIISIKCSSFHFIFPLRLYCLFSIFLHFTLFSSSYFLYFALLFSLLCITLFPYEYLSARMASCPRHALSPCILVTTFPSLPTFGAALSDISSNWN